MQKLALPLLLLLTLGTLRAQPDSLLLARRQPLLDSLRLFVAEWMGLHVKENFYKEWQSPDTPMLYLYVSSAKEVKNILGSSYRYFGSDYAEAVTVRDSLKKVGLHTMLYSTAGTASARLNRRLLLYPDECLAFIFFHEAVHQHLRTLKHRVPYECEEAMADVVANYVTLDYFSANAASVKQLRWNGRMFTYINKWVKTGPTPKAAKRLQELLAGANAFQKDRFDYPLNNAWLLRYTYYAGKYRELLAVYRKHAQTRLFVEAVVAMYPEQ